MHTNIHAQYESKRARERERNHTSPVLCLQALEKCDAEKKEAAEAVPVEQKEVPELEDLMSVLAMKKGNKEEVSLKESF
jgi:hypothetical protein